MKADRFCKVENMTPEEAIKSINECSWESAAMAMPPYWEVKIIHGKGENPLLWGACYQIKAASINTEKQGKFSTKLDSLRLLCKRLALTDCSTV